MLIFRGNAIPAIIAPIIKQGWNKAGLESTIFLMDCSTLQETLLTVDESFSFSYTKEDFISKVLAALLKRIEGECLFTNLCNNYTKITYKIIIKNFDDKIIISLTDKNKT